MIAATVNGLYILDVAAAVAFVLLLCWLADRWERSQESDRRRMWATLDEREAEQASTPESSMVIRGESLKPAAEMRRVALSRSPSVALSEREGLLPGVRLIPALPGTEKETTRQSPGRDSRSESPAQTWAELMKQIG